MEFLRRNEKVTKVIKRFGIHAAGNFLVDLIKIIDNYPNEGMLANIISETIGTGGGPFNVLTNLAKLKVKFPLFATAVLGNDEHGKYILRYLKEKRIDTSNVFVNSKLPTSYTDVYSVDNSGQRTFFHYRGSNGLLDYHHFKNVSTNAKIFHLAYLLLLEKLDKKDSRNEVVAEKVLTSLQRKGYKTSVDLISEDSKRYKNIVKPCLPYINYLIINEIEAAKITGVTIRKNKNKININSLNLIVDLLFKYGVKNIVAIHFPEGGFAANKSGDRYFLPSYKIEKNEIKGTNGAGDSFCAGMLYGIHEELPLEKCIKIANANARFSLKSPTCTDGIVSLKELKKFMITAELNKVTVDKN